MYVLSITPTSLFIKNSNYFKLEIFKYNIFKISFISNSVNNPYSITILAIYTACTWAILLLLFILFFLYNLKKIIIDLNGMHLSIAMLLQK